mmetsp:Transcript_1880/g.2600  ORF Transcript_1880/g.2600 Transcript_1880/m.2600 type:complete len:143 (+) Transcript_1880:30-458(+)
MNSDQTRKSTEIDFDSCLLGSSPSQVQDFPSHLNRSKSRQSTSLMNFESTTENKIVLPFPQSNRGDSRHIDSKKQCVSIGYNESFSDVSIGNQSFSDDFQPSTPKCQSREIISLSPPPLSQSERKVITLSMPDDSKLLMPFF